MVIMENTTNHQNLSVTWNFTEDLKSAPERSFTNISFGLGCCITILNVSAMFFLLRNRNCIRGDGFWQQLVFLCSTDILSGVAIALPQFGYFFFEIHSNIYYSFCSFGLSLYSLSITLSGGNCFMISFYRYIVMRNIDNPITKWHKHASHLMIISNVILCVITVSSSMLVVTSHFGFEFVEFCDKLNFSGQNEYKKKYIIGCVIILSLFLLGTNILSVLCILKVKTTSRFRHAITSSCNSTSQANRYASVTFIIVVMAMNLTTAPSLLFMYLSINKLVNVSFKAREVILRLISFNSFCNPFIYFYRSSQFRSAVLNDIAKFLSRLKCTPDRRVHPEL